MTDHHNCAALLQYLSDYIDDELEDQQLCQDIESHLADCQNCQIMVDTLKKTVYLYHSSAEKAHLPEDVRQRLFSSLDLEQYLDHPSD